MKSSLIPPPPLNGSDQITLMQLQANLLPVDKPNIALAMAPQPTKFMIEPKQHRIISSSGIYCQMDM